MPEISKLSFRSYLKPNSTTRLIAHFMAWFDKKNHLDIGYTSTDIEILRWQVENMASRGIEIANVDWYGFTNVFIDTVTKMLKGECESRKDFKFCITADDGLFKKIPTGVSPTEFMLAQIKYIRSTYMTSAQYARTKDGRFLMFEFGMGSRGLDWNRIHNAYPEIAILHRNNGGYGVPASAGAYSWLDSTHSSAGYLKDFISVAQKNTNKITCLSWWKGFDDHNRKLGGDPTQSVWGGTARFADERNGQLFLETVAVSQTFDAEFIQIVTWNDYEEGTAFEPGIENGVTVGISHNGSVVQCNPSGNTATIDTIEPWIDVDTKSIQLNDAGTVDLSILKTSPGTYTAQFKAIGKAGFINKLSPVEKVTAKLAWS
jgi:hypothetical protein